MLFSAFAASSTPVVVSDDRAFLSHLGRISQSFVVPALLIVEMARQGALNQEQAREAMDRLRPFIRTDHYNEAKLDLEDLI
ncbi:MAG: hypothetical protein CMJ45_13230 [Planctomyces sp.]|nr:hypothetical protein [Planctomyces sp.]